MKRKAYSRGERQDMILDVFYSMVGDNKSPHMTAYQMAKTLGLNSAQHVRNLMDEMVLDHRLTFWQVTHRPGVDKKVYCPFPLIPIETPDRWEEPKLRFLGKEVK